MAANIDPIAIMPDSARDAANLMARLKHNRMYIRTAKELQRGRKACGTSADKQCGFRHDCSRIWQWRRGDAGEPGNPRRLAASSITTVTGTAIIDATQFMTAATDTPVRHLRYCQRNPTYLWSERASPREPLFVDDANGGLVVCSWRYYPVWFQTRAGCKSLSRMIGNRLSPWKAYHDASAASSSLIGAVPRALIVFAVLFAYTSVSVLDRQRRFDYPEPALAIRRFETRQLAAQPSRNSGSCRGVHLSSGAVQDGSGSGLTVPQRFLASCV